MDKKDIALLKKVISDLQLGTHYKAKIYGETLEKWKQEIINFFKTGITNAFTESHILK